MENNLFGAPKYTSSSTQQRNHKIEPGHNFFRLGPPYKSLAASGKWNVYQATHFGYVGVNRQDPSKTVARPFLCPQEKNRRTGMTITPCKECDKIDVAKSTLEAREASLKAEGRSEQEVAQLTEPMTAWLKSHNVSKKFNTIAKNDKGEWGILPLSIKTKQMLDAKIQQLLNEDGLSALDATDGVWFDIIRTGEGFKTTYDVQVVMETQVVDGKRMKIVKTDTLTQKDIDDIVAYCPDLSTIGTRLTQEQIAALANSNGDPEEVDNIFGMAQTERSKPRVPASAPAAAPAAAPAPAQSTPVAPPAAAPSAPAAAPAVQPDVAALMAQLAALQAQIATQSKPAAEPAPAAPAPTPAPAAVPAPAVTPTVVAKDLDNDQFVRMFGSVK